MDKGLIVKIGVVILALLFLIEPLSMGIQNWAGSGENEVQGDVYVGSANVNATIYSYGAFLYLNAPTDLQKSQILANPEVLNLEEVDEGVWRITLRDSSKTKDVYTEFGAMGISTLAIAQIGLPDTYTIQLEDGSRMEIRGGYQQFFMEPILDTGSTISYMLIVESDGSSTYQILDAKSYYSQVELQDYGTIVGANTSAYAFSIPWEERNLDVEELYEEYGEENVLYTKNDYVVFSPTLSAGETVALKTEYVTYISEGSASVLEDFTNKTQAEADFMGRATFPDSTLFIKATQEPELEYEFEKRNTYTVELTSPFDGYELGLQRIELASQGEYSLNQSVPIAFNASVTGNTVLGVMEIGIVE